MIIKPIATTLATLVLLSSAIASSTVSAAEYEGYFENPQFTSTRSRAEVKQETVQAQRAGLLNTGELGAGFAPLTGQDGNKTAVARKTLKSWPNCARLMPTAAMPKTTAKLAF